VTWIELRKPLPIPYKPIHVAWTDGDTFEFQPRNAKRMSLPADYVADDLRTWNQHANLFWNHWRLVYSWKDYFSIAYGLIREGSSIWFHRVDDYKEKSRLNYPRSTAHNWSHDKTNHKYSYEFYLDNDLEETSPTEIYDDDETIWSEGGWVDGTVWVYGPTYSDLICFHVYDNWNGWKRLVLPLNNPDETIGSFDRSQVIAVKIRFLNAELGQTWFIDRSVADVGQWVKVEMYVPDVLLDGDNNGYPKAFIQCYNPSTASWTTPLIWDQYEIWGTGPSNPQNYAPAGYFLDGSRWDEVYGGIRAGASLYLQGERGETKDVTGYAAYVDVTAGGITYSSYYGCKKRLGFAVKMPPDDGQDASDAGISQCKFKVFIYYDKETYAGVDRYGATYEFENSTNKIYGLQLMNESWIALFPDSGPSKGAEMLFLSAKPTGLEVSADEDEVIYRVKLTLPKGTAVYAGSLLHGDVTLDSDGDGVPDCLEMLSYQLTGQ